MDKITERLAEDRRTVKDFITSQEVEIGECVAAGQYKGTEFFTCEIDGAKAEVTVKGGEPVMARVEGRDGSTYCTEAVVSDPDIASWEREQCRYRSFTFVNPNELEKARREQKDLSARAIAVIENVVKSPEKYTIDAVTPVCTGFGAVREISIKGENGEEILKINGDKVIFPNGKTTALDDESGQKIFELTEGKNGMRELNEKDRLKGKLAY